MKKTIVLFLAIAMAGSLSAQKYMTKNGNVRFFSTTPVEDIEAVTNTVNVAVDASTGDVFFKILIKSFKFEKALMQEHFNENYMESGKFPNAEFTGKIVNIKDVNFSKDGEYAVTVEGTMTIHGVSKKITEKGTIIVKGGKVQLKSKFNVKPADYNISIPGAVRNKIAESIEVSVDALLNPVKP
jgi:polyisoprenoid-binding protein YceI